MRNRVETHGLLLRSVDYGESDKVCTFLLAEGGKVAAFARGARGSKKRFRGGLGALVELRVVLSVPGGDRLASLAESEAMAAHTQIGSDLDRVAAGTLALELVDLSLEDGQGEELYPTLVRFVRWLANEDGPAFRVEAGLHRLQLVLLNQLGSLPPLAACARSHAPLDDAAFWVPQVGLVAPAARHPGEAGAELPPDALAYFRGIVAGTFPTSDQPAARRALRRALRDIWRHELRKDPKSWSFFVGQFGDVG